MLSASFATLALSSSFATTASYVANMPSESLNALSASYLDPGANIYLSQSYIFSNTESFSPNPLEGQMWWDSINHTYTIDSANSRLKSVKITILKSLPGKIF